MNKSVKTYDGAVVTDSCEFVGRAVIGQDTYCDSSLFERGVQLNRRNIVVDSSMGRHTYTGANTIIKHADVGAFCSISWNVTIGGGFHDYECATAHPLAELPSFGFVENESTRAERTSIGNDVWIGCGAVVLPGASVGDGAVIGAGSVVTKDVAPFAVVAGSPAKLIRERFPEEVVRMMLESRWWFWDDRVIKENISLFKGKMNVERAAKMLEVSRFAMGFS